MKPAIAIKDVLADPTHPLHDVTQGMIAKLASGEISMCSCIGPIGDDLHCPCAMRRMGFKPTNTWTPEKVAELGRALAIFEVKF